MYRNRKRGSSGLLEWSMFDHDESPDDICEFDDPPSFSQRANIKLSPTSSCAIDESCSNKTAALASEEFFQDETPSASQETQADHPSCTANVSSSRIVADSWSSVYGGSGLTASASCATRHKKRKTRNFNTCEIDDTSNDESASSPTRNGIERRGSFTIDETTDDELACTPNPSPSKQANATAHAQCQPIPVAPVARSPRREAVPKPDLPACPLRESVLKNGLQEGLIRAVRKMDSELALWNCYKSNASFPKRLLSGGPAPLTARIVSTESLYGSTYCTCHLVDSESGTNFPEALSLVFPSEVSESEGFGRDTVLRVYPPWREYMVQGEPSKVLTAIQFYEVLDKGNDRVT
ncbi:unnamed protein product [Ixodes hexagonus]